MLRGLPRVVVFEEGRAPMLREGPESPVVYTDKSYFSDPIVRLRLYFSRFGSVVVYSATGDYTDLIEED